MSTVTTKFDMPEDDERRLINMLNRIHELRSTLSNPKAPIIPRTDTAEKRELSPIEQEIVAMEKEVLTIVDDHFRSSLRGIMTKLFGADMASKNQHQEVALRFTEMLNNFFVKILETRHDAFWRARTAKDLRKWASTVNANLMRDALRRDKRGREILEQISPLLEDRQRHFQKTAHIELTDEVIDAMSHWADSEDESDRMLGRILIHRYLDGMPYMEIAYQLGLIENNADPERKAKAESEVKALRERGIKQLRERFRNDPA
ncbi:MAG: hypothetical protein ACKV0T_20320 [Planctomycetales bacterium]